MRNLHTALMFASLSSMESGTITEPDFSFGGSISVDKKKPKKGNRKNRSKVKAARKANAKRRKRNK